MPPYTVQGRFKSGAVQTFEVLANSEREASELILNKGLEVVSVVALATAPTAAPAEVAREIIRQLAADPSVRADVVKIFRRAIYNGVAWGVIAAILLYIVIFSIVVFVLIVAGAVLVPGRG